MTTITHSAPKRLLRSTSDRMIGGVCAGLGSYANLDPTVVRVVFAIATIATGIVPGLLAYLVLLFLIPSERR